MSVLVCGAGRGAGRSQSSPPTPQSLDVAPGVVSLSGVMTPVAGLRGGTWCPLKVPNGDNDFRLTSESRALPQRRWRLLDTRRKEKSFALRGRVDGGSHLDERGPWRGVRGRLLSGGNPAEP